MIITIYQVLTAVNMKITVFLDVTLSTLLDSYESFGETCYLQFQGRRWRQQIPWGIDNYLLHYNVSTQKAVNFMLLTVLWFHFLQDWATIRIVRCKMAVCLIFCCTIYIHYIFVFTTVHLNVIYKVHFNVLCVAVNIQFHYFLLYLAVQKR